MLPAIRRLSCLACLILAGSLLAGAQLLCDDPARCGKPQPKPQPKPIPSASLLVTTDLDCNWALDGVSQGRLTADSAKTVPVSPGKHLVQAVSSDRRDKWQSFVTVGQTGQEAIQIQLLSVKQAREGKSQQDAAERKRQQEEAARRREEERRPKPQYPANLKFEFVQIRPGEFDMGCSPGEGACSSDEKPQHHVRISKGFEMGKYLVTQAMWESVMGSNPSYFKGADRPVEQVSWNDAQEFLQRLNAKNDGYRYRLPTEAEWEYAARAGSTAARYGELDAVAWYSGNSGSQTHLVGQKQANAWGLYDMLGNVYEWVQDWYGENYYGQSPGTNPQGPSSGERRVLRGGSWNVLARYVRASCRGNLVPGSRVVNFGVRCVREVK
jgi:formylglycine-generating enzyme required for sulfatase activity